MPQIGLSIGDLAARTGLAVSAIRFYETHGIVKPLRNAGGHRRYGHSDLRRLSFAMIAQNLGFSLAAIGTEMASLPDHKAPSRADWSKVAVKIRHNIQNQIQALEKLSDKVDGCIGCGCLSLDTCALYNAGDHAAAAGPGPRFLISTD